MTASTYPLRKYFVTLLLICISLNIWGQNSTSSTNQNALLWEISGKELSQPSYLFGTIHMIGKEDFILSDSTKAALNRSAQVTFEINMEDMTDFSKIMPLMMQAFMKNDTTLSDLLSSEEYGIVEAHFQKIGLPLVFLQKIKPMFLSAFGAEDLFSAQGNSDEVVSYEFELMKLAQDGDKNIQGLETAEFQMSMFDSIPYKVQAQMLVETIKSGNSDDQEFKKMVELYKNQDIEGMQDLMKDDQEGIGKYEELLLINRNKNWIPLMAEMMMEKPTFFAVGAGHLGGKSGVINLLQAEGYQLKPISW